MKRLMDLQTRQQTLLKEDEDITYNKEKYQNELEEQNSKIERAANSAEAKLNNLATVNPNV